MSAKVDQTPAVEPRNVKISTTATSSTVSSSASKVSMFAAKSGFVIPKNKLSGSLVPIFRGGKHQGGSDAANEDTSNQKRKTKWGPDLTQDAAVRKGRALAYQTRLDQITRQLKLGNLEVGINQDSPSAAQSADDKASSQVGNEESELMELERRETIGEILKLNPSYKAPLDYKPLLKEARVPIPVKEYPGYNFVSLIFGHVNDTQKRLEKETGARIQVYGITENTGKKVEITPTSGNERQDAHDKLYVLVSADTFEKVDAAVALIEMLVTSVTGNIGSVSTPTSVSADKANAVSHGAASPYTGPTSAAQQGVGPTQTPVPAQFRFPGPWFSAGPHPTSMQQPHDGSSMPILTNPVPVQLPPVNPSNMPSLFGPRPPPVTGFNSMIHGTSFISPQYMPQTPLFGHMGPPNNVSMQAPRLSSSQPNISAPLPFSGSQPQPSGTIPFSRPLISSLSQPVPNVPLRPVPDRPLITPGSPIGWSGATAGGASSMTPQNVGQFSSLVITPHGRQPPPSISTFPSQHSTPHLNSAPINRPMSSVFASLPPSQVGPVPSLSASLRPTSVALPMHTPTQVLSSSPVMPVAPSQNLSLIPSPVPSRPPPLPLPSRIPTSDSGGTTNFTPIKPTVVTAPAAHPCSTDFTFRPHQSQNPTSQPLVPRPLGHPALNPRPPLEPPRPQVGNQMRQPLPHMSGAPFAGNQAAMSAPPRLPPYPSAASGAPLTPPYPNAASGAPLTPVLQMGPRNFAPPPLMPNQAGPFPHGPSSPVQFQQNYPTLANRPASFGPFQQFNTGLQSVTGKIALNPSSGQQIYDPFSPSVAVGSQQLRGNPPRLSKQESDPEYEDLMASVGVK